MITISTVRKEISKIRDNRDALDTSCLDTLYKLMVVEHFMSSEKEKEESPIEGEIMAMDEGTAKEWVNSMTGSDGTNGEHWTLQQTTTVLSQKGYSFNPVDFYVTMNMMYNDYVKVARRFNINNVDFYASLSEAFLDDKDAVSDKLAKYHKHIAA